METPSPTLPRNFALDFSMAEVNSAPGTERQQGKALEKMLFLIVLLKL